jgi:hypothetical protein
MKKIFPLFLLFFTINITSAQSKKLLAATIEGRGCSGTEYCTACKNCSGCKHCAKEGGLCGVCTPASKKKTVSTKTKSAKNSSKVRKH